MPAEASIQTVRVTPLSHRNWILARAAMTRGSPTRPNDMDTRNLADLYGLPALDWTTIAARLEEGFSQAPGTGGPDRHTCWLTTLGVDGGPHVTGVGALWVDGAFWCETGERSRKGRNLARDPRCALSLATSAFDLVVEGTAAKVTDPATMATLAGAWAAEGWPCRVDESGIALTAEYSAPSAGPPPWSVYRIAARTATALSTVEPGGATRWTF
jgi:pyridoxamine 5'-phosphate oxidase-like protein